MGKSYCVCCQLLLLRDWLELGWEFLPWASPCFLSRTCKPDLPCLLINCSSTSLSVRYTFIRSRCTILSRLPPVESTQTLTSFVSVETAPSRWLILRCSRSPREPNTQLPSQTQGLSRRQILSQTKDISRKPEPSQTQMPPRDPGMIVRSSWWTKSQSLASP